MWQKSEGRVGSSSSRPTVQNPGIYSYSRVVATFNPLLAGKINGVVSTPLILVFWLEKKFNGVVSTPLIFHPKNRYILDGVETTPLILEIFSFITFVTKKIN